ncbi:MAG: metallophosphoesterase [Promethearchaeota archaeon]|nr:MAG: metallophosphoesterase [Candidatus Lokiarchaeota archaeon]
MVELIHWSDLHYGSSEFRKEYFDNVIDYINDKKPDAVVCTGDFTHHGRKIEYKNVSELLRQVKVPTLNVIGNHDAVNNGIVFFERYIAPRRSTLTLKEKDIFILGVRSPRDNTSEGELCDEQIEWMTQQLNKSNEKIKVLALHHHLVAVPSAGHKRGTLVDAGEALQLVQDYDISLVLQGHRHVPHAWCFGGSILLYCGTSTSEKVRADDNPCFNEISINNEKLEVYIVDSLTLERNLLIRQDRGKIKYLKPRNDRINHIINSRIFQNFV